MRKRALLQRILKMTSSDSPAAKLWNLVSEKEQGRLVLNK
jgi:hypothetical protein